MMSRHNPARMRAWMAATEDVRAEIDNSFLELSSTCTIVTALVSAGGESTLDEVFSLLLAVAARISNALDEMAAAPRIPDLTLDMMLAGAIGKWRRAITPLLVSHPLDCEGCDMEHLDLERWGDLNEQASRSWVRLTRYLES